METGTMVTETGGQRVIATNVWPTRHRLPAKRTRESKEVPRGPGRQAGRRLDRWRLKDETKGGLQTLPSRQI